MANKLIQLKDGADNVFPQTVIKPNRTDIRSQSDFDNAISIPHDFQMVIYDVINVQVGDLPLGGGIWLIMSFFTDNQYGIQLAFCYGNAKGIVMKRSLFDGNWSTWGDL